MTPIQMSDKIEKLNQTVKDLKYKEHELLDAVNRLGYQIVDLKGKYELLLVDIKILKEGGNL